jgi:hypothetical protein
MLCAQFLSSVSPLALTLISPLLGMQAAKLVANIKSL